MNFTLDTNVLALLTLLINAIALPLLAVWIRKLEKNTNSLKDDLVKTTKEAALATGKLEGHEAGMAAATQAQRDAEFVAAKTLVGKP